MTCMTAADLSVTNLARSFFPTHEECRYFNLEVVSRSLSSLRHVHSHEDSPRLNVLSVRDVVEAVQRPNLGFSPTQQRPSTQMNPHRRRKTSTVSFSPIVHPWSFTPGHISRLQQSLNVIEKRSWERSHGSTLLISLASLHSDSFLASVF